MLQTGLDFYRQSKAAPKKGETQSYKDLVLAPQIIIILLLALDPAQAGRGLLSLNSMTPSLSPLFQHLWPVGTESSSLVPA